MNGGEALTATFEQQTDQIDHRVCPLDRAFDRPAMAQIGLNGGDLADIAQRLQMKGEVGPADGDAHPVAALRQRAHDMAADKSRSAKHRHHFGKVCLFGHRCLRISLRHALATYRFWPPR